MENNFDLIQELLRQKADLEARISLLAYDGTPEIKENASGKYIYIRKRVLTRVTSEYIGLYSDDLYGLVVRSTRQAKDLKKQIKGLDKELSRLGYISSDLPDRVQQNLDFARVNMKANIYDQAILEGVATTFPQTETIIENGKVSGMTASDVQKILNLKHAWEFILDKGVISSKSDFYILSYIAKFVNEGFYDNGGRVRGVPVAIGGTNYIPPLPVESVVKENIELILNSQKDYIDIAIELCLYCMKTQIFNDGNKRASVIYANHYLISKGEGLIVIPEKEVPTFKKMLIDYYEGKDEQNIKAFMKDKCWRRF